MARRSAAHGLGPVVLAAVFFGLIAAPRGFAAERYNAALSSITRDDLRRHLSFLASDALEGREAGSRGGQAAAAYIADRLKVLGLQPAGEDRSYVQEFGRGYRNVLGVWPGSDPVLTDEFILIGGHLDHVGYGNRSNSNGPIGQIHNGADDNASGVAGILEVAEALTKLSSPPPRSILFAFWDGEEKGMLGSKYWVQNATRPLPGVRLAINLDMIGRLRDDTLTAYGTRTAQGLRQFVVRANEAQLRIKFDLEHRDDSDHFTFYENSVPYLMLFTGDHPDYHRPSDDVDRVNFEGLERVARLVLNIAAEAAETPRLAAFRPECRRETSQHRLTLVDCPPRLGITWSGRRQPGEPFSVTGVDPGSPAEAAGLHSGDVLVAVEGRPAGEVDDLQRVVAEADTDLRLSIKGPDQLAPLDVVIGLTGCPVPAGVELRSDPADAAAELVVRVAGASLAAKAGLASGDRLLLSKVGSLAPTAAEHHVWQVERDGRLKTVSME